MVTNSWIIVRRLGTIDLFPQFSGRVRQVVASPLGVLMIAAMIAALCGLAVHPRVFALSGGLLAVAVAGVCWPWVTIRGLRASIRFDANRVSEGNSVRVIVTLTNHLPWPALGLTLQGGLGSANDSRSSHLARLPTVPGRSQLTAGWAWTPSLRGDYPLECPRISTSFPFGIGSASQSTVVTSRLLVWPSTLPVGPVPSATGMDVPDGNVTRNKVGSTGEVLGTRPYRRGDSPRRIHWSQSARHDRLIVCELQSNSRPIVFLILDADPSVHTSGPQGSREWSIRILASLARGWLSNGAQVGVSWNEFVLPPASGTAQLTAIMNGLARLPQQGKPIAEVLQSPAIRVIRTGLRVVMTTDAADIPSSQGFSIVRVHRAGFGSDEAKPHKVTERLTTQAWLDIPSADRIPELLRTGWSEARHGS